MSLFLMGIPSAGGITTFNRALATGANFAKRGAGFITRKVVVPAAIGIGARIAKNTMTDVIRGQKVSSSVIKNIKKEADNIYGGLGNKTEAFIKDNVKIPETLKFLDNPENIKKAAQTVGKISNAAEEFLKENRGSLPDAVKSILDMNSAARSIISNSIEPKPAYDTIKKEGQTTLLDLARALGQAYGAKEYKKAKKARKALKAPKVKKVKKAKKVAKRS